MSGCGKARFAGNSGAIAKKCNAAAATEEQPNVKIIPTRVLSRRLIAAQRRGRRSDRNDSYGSGCPQHVCKRRAGRSGRDDVIHNGNPPTSNIAAELESAFHVFTSCYGTE